MSIAESVARDLAQELVVAEQRIAELEARPPLSESNAITYLDLIIEKKNAEIAQLREHVDHWTGTAAGYFKELHALREQVRWIPVGERLPNAKEWVLVNKIGETGLNAYVAETRFGMDDWENDFEALTEITHWMPLPAPPEEERK